MTREREFEFSDRHFRTLKDLVSTHTGIMLSDGKQELIYGRLSRRLRTLGLKSFDPYCTLIQQGNSDELVNFVNSVTTNLTAFFREAHHFEYLASTLLPELMDRNRHSRRIRIWSAGCSTGEEAYTLAMVLRESIPDIGNWDVKILATDIDSSVVDKARNGVYSEDRVEGISTVRLKKWFLKGKEKMSGLVRVSPRLQELISFRQLNLMHQWPVRGPFDAIFCRNVVIYFDKPTQAVLFDRFADLLTDGGHMFIGHSETLFRVSDRFELLGQTIHRKCA